VKLTNVLETSFGERCNFVREDKMFVKDEAKFRVKSKKTSSHQGRDLLKSVSNVKNV